MRVGLSVSAKIRIATPPGTVALVCDLAVVDALELARSLLDCALDVLLRHRRGFRRFDRGAKSRITGGIAAAELRGHRDFANQLGEMRAALRVGRGLVMLDLLPFAMAGHCLRCWVCLVR